MTKQTTTTPPNIQTHRHGLWADVQAILFGSGISAAAVVILTNAGLITGQTAGLAVLISYVTGYGFGPVFFLVNLPFYGLALARMGWVFTVKTFISVGLLSLFSGIIPLYFQVGYAHPAVAALIFGMMAASGLLALFRHGSSLGGVGILAVYLQDKTGFRVGYTQLLLDLALFATAFFVIDAALVLYSLLAALVVNVTIAVNHRKDWYVAS